MTRRGTVGRLALRLGAIGLAAAAFGAFTAAPALADGGWKHGHHRGGWHKPHHPHHGYRGYHGPRYYGAPRVVYAPPPRVYHVPPPRVYYAPPPVYYEPPSISFVFPLRLD